MLDWDFADDCLCRCHPKFDGTFAAVLLHRYCESSDNSLEGAVAAAAAASRGPANLSKDLNFVYAPCMATSVLSVLEAQARQNFEEIALRCAKVIVSSGASAIKTVQEQVSSLLSEHQPEPETAGGKSSHGFDMSSHGSNVNVAVRANLQRLSSEFRNLPNSAVETITTLFGQLCCNIRSGSEAYIAYLRASRNKTPYYASVNGGSEGVSIDPDVASQRVAVDLLYQFVCRLCSIVEGAGCGLKVPYQYGLTTKSTTSTNEFASGIIYSERKNFSFPWRPTHGSSADWRLFLAFHPPVSVEAAFPRTMSLPRTTSPRLDGLSSGSRTPKSPVIQFSPETLLIQLWKSIQLESNGVSKSFQPPLQMSEALYYFQFFRSSAVVNNDSFLTRLEAELATSELLEVTAGSKLIKAIRVSCLSLYIYLQDTCFYHLVRGNVSLVLKRALSVSLSN
jgi:hypothetical protein